MRFIGKSTVNGHFQWFFVCLPEGQSSSININQHKTSLISLERRCWAHELRHALGPGGAVVPGLPAWHRHQRRLRGADVGALRGLPAGAGHSKQTLGWKLW